MHAEMSFKAIKMRKRKGIHKLIFSDKFKEIRSAFSRGISSTYDNALTFQSVVAFGFTDNCQIFVRFHSIVWLLTIISIFIFF